MIVNQDCWERGCACHDSRVDGPGVEVMKRAWVGLSNGEMVELSVTELGKWDLILEVENKLKEKNNAS